MLWSWAARCAQPQGQGWYTPVFSMTLSVVSHFRTGSQKRNNLFAENEILLALVVRSRKAAFCLYHLGFLGPSTLPSSPCMCAELDQNQTEALSDACASICCLLLVDANHSEPCLKLLDTWLEEEKENSSDGPTSSCFSFLKIAVLSNIIKPAQLCTLGLNCIVWKPSSFFEVRALYVGDFR